MTYNIEQIQEKLLDTYRSMAEQSIETPGVKHAVFCIGNMPSYIEFSDSRTFDKFTKIFPTTYIGAYHKS